MKLLVIILSVLTGILNGEYNAQTLSAEKQDSILNVQKDDAQCTRYRLEKENAQKIFRRSEVADWFVVDTMRKTRKRLGEGMFKGEEVKVRDAVMSPNGRYVAFAKDNNLYIHKLDFGTEVAVTKEENTDLISGVADWLYEEEFGTTALFAWSPDSKQLAFVKLDETEVPSFSWEVYSDTQYPKLESLRYPKAGCKNAKASVCVYDVATKGILTMQTNPKNEDVYFPRLQWYDENTLFVVRMNRDQTKMEVLSCNAKSTVVSPWHREESKQYFVDYELFDQWQWLSDGRMIVVSEQEGWRRAYLYGKDGSQLRALTPDGIDVTAVYGVNEKTQTLYYQAAPTPSTRQIYAVNIKKADAPVQISAGEGTHSARLSDDGTRMIECFHSFTTPHTYTLYTLKGAKAVKVEVILDHSAMKQRWEANHLPEPQMMQINGLEAMLLIDRSAERAKTASLKEQRPLVLMHYSGPQSQRVLNRWRKRFEYALVEAGYAVLIVDPRGSDCKGRAWRNETYMNLGVKEAEDLIMAAREIAKRPDIDGERMAIMGWSYGGYETLMTMSQKDHPFKAGVAIAPVTDWRLYDSAYTERYMRRPQVNDHGYESASLLPRAKDLTGKMLLIHGTADDNVHVQQAWQYIDALVKADKPFEMQFYPDDNHFLKKGNNALHMHNRILEFLSRNL